ncbi:integrase catalytic domain-containing protein [Haliangium sp.]|uniref:integrase catalytic domain-containing protein n=1 Tax=Haliangium sp. TaxID=2663208 RepID=UPI003D0A7715
MYAPGHQTRSGESCELTPSVLAGLLLEARSHLHRLGLPCPSPSEIVSASQVSSSHAYQRRAEVRASLRASRRPRGRPAPCATPDIEAGISQRVLRFVFEHPGSVTSHGGRRFYSDEFKALILALRQDHPELTTRVFARTVQVQPTTLRRWEQSSDRSSARARRPRTDDAPSARVAACTANARTPEARLVDAWRSWRGSFSGFCKYAQTHLGLPWQRTAISRHLADAGLRTPVPRRAQPHSTEAPRGAFLSFFPGALWTSDGTVIKVTIDGQEHVFNLQLVVDTDSGAIVGMSVRDHEDGIAVRDAFADAVQTTGAPPLGLVLDRRPSNHGAEVAELNRHTTVVHAGKNRPQSKGHVEGAFGLFSQLVPALELELGRDPRTLDPRALARQLLSLVVQTWARTCNHRPRRSRGQRSRFDLYRSHQPDPVLDRRARADIARRAWRSRGRRRCNGTELGLHRFVRTELAALGIPDPSGYVATVLSGRPADAVLEGLAVYHGKQAAGTLPDDADGPYLLGIVERLCEDREGQAISAALWHTRGAAREHVLATLDDMEARARAGARARVDDPSATDAVDNAVDHAMDADSDCDRRMWLAVAARIIRAAPGRYQRRLYRRASHRLVAHRRLRAAARLRALRILAAELIPLHA